MMQAAAGVEPFHRVALNSPLSFTPFPLSLTHMACLRVLPFAVMVAQMLALAGCSSSESSRPYRVGRDPSWYGLTLDSQEVPVTAFCDDLMLHMARQEGIPLELVTLGWHQLEPALEEGVVDAVLTAAPLSCDNQAAYCFSSGFLEVGPVLVTRMDREGDTIEGFDGRIVAVRSQSPTEVVMANLPSVMIRSYDSTAVALHDVLWKKVDAAAMNLLTAASYTRNLYCGKLRIATGPMTNDALRMAVKRDSGRGGRLLVDFEQALSRLREQGVYSQLVTKWGLTQPPFEACIAGAAPCLDAVR
jgi:polar amino acid transport system substrate-binding protein